MKKTWILPLLLALVLGLCACGGSNKETSASPTEGTAPESSSASGTTASTETGETQSAETDDRFFAGFGRTDITPWESTPLAGYGNTAKRLGLDVLDPLKANCVALRDGNGETVLLFMLDVINAAEAVVEQLRQSVNAATGVAKDHIYIGCSHTHSAPDLTLSSSYAIMRYRNYLNERLPEAAVQAIADLKPCTASTGSAEIEGLNFVRHYKLTNGTYAGDNYGDFSSAPIEGYETEADHICRLLRFEREGAKDILLMNFQVHPHRTGGINKTNVSSDVVSRIRNYVEEREDVFCTYMQGGAGNINPTSRITEDMLTEDYKEFGKIFGTKVIWALPTMTPIDLGPIKISGCVTFTGEVDHSQDTLVAKASEIYTVFTSTGDRAKCTEMGRPYGIHSCYHASAIINKARLPKTMDLELDALSFGDIGLVTAPYEMFDVNANYVRDNSPYAFTLVMAYCNGSASYIAADYAFDNTCYEADQCRYVKGTAEKLASTMVDMLGELKQQADPTEKVTVTAPEQEDPLAGLTCDGTVYFNYGYAHYQGEVSRPRQLTADGTVYTMTLMNQDGEIESVEVLGKKACLQADLQSLVCLWRDKDGKVAAASSPEKLGYTITWNNFVAEVKDSTVSLNSGANKNGVARTLTVTEDTKYAMVPESALATEPAGKATRLLEKDKVTLVEDEKGAIKALFILSRENDERNANEVNLALKAELSYTYPLVLNNKYFPYLINDGSEAAGLTDCAGFKFVEGGEILFELESLSVVTGYKLINEDEPETYGGVKDYEIYTSVDGSEWTLLASGTGMSKEFRKGSFGDGVNAKFVKLVITDSHCNTKLGPETEDKRIIRIAEFEIFGIAGEVVTENLALKAQVTYTYPLILTNKYFPYLINDGSLADELNDCAGFKFSEEGEILFELEKLSAVTGYKLVNMVDPEVYGGVKDFEVYASADGTDWKLLDSYQGLVKGFRKNNFAEAVSAKYIKLVITDSHCNTKLSADTADKRIIRIAEFEIFGY